jgi:rfaE bifunctional protein nucleotidyltransferase chain/domain
MRARPARMLQPDELSEWCGEVRHGGGRVAVVAGSFRMLQPGNVAVMLKAAAAAEDVLVLVTPPEGGTPARSEDAMVLAASLRGVSAVCACSRADAVSRAAHLGAYTWVSCADEDGEEALCAALAESAAARIPVERLPGCSSDEIVRAIADHATPVAVPYQVAKDAYRPRCRHSGVTVTINGCFDVLHPGHLQFMERARTLGDRLIVLLNDDASVQRYKGPLRPIFPLAFRLRALRSLRSVTAAHAFREDDPLKLLEELRPQIHAKGGTYVEERVRAERELVAGWGGRLEFLPMVGDYSTTATVQTMAGGA